MDAERAFAGAARARRRAALMALAHRRPACRLAVFDERALPPADASPRRGVREIPLDAIGATLEPNRAEQFDCGFRPTPLVRGRWQRVWLAEQRGVVLPPISVVPVGDGYAVRDGHHRISVARARGALTIDAIIEAI